MVYINDLHKQHNETTGRGKKADPLKIGRSSPKTPQKESDPSTGSNEVSEENTKPQEPEEDNESEATPEPDPHPGLGHLSSEFYEFLRYIFFLGLFCFVVFGSRSSDAYFVKETMDAFFFENDFDFETSFTDIGSMGQFWIFMNTTLLPNLYPTTNDGSGQPLSRRKKLFLADGTNFRLGLVRIRQLRMRPGLCSQTGINEACYPGWDTCLTDYSCNEDKEDYNPGRLHGLNSNSTRVWPWYSMKELKMPWYRSAATGTEYPGDGYIEDLGAPNFGYSFAPTAMPSGYTPTLSQQPSIMPTPVPSNDHSGPSRLPTFMPTTVETGDPRDEIAWIAQQQLNTLRSLDWVDWATRVVIVEFNVYCPNTDMFGSVRMSVEFTGTGTVVPSYSVVSTPLMHSLRVYNRDGVSRFQRRSMYVEIAFYFFVLYYFLEEYREWMSARREIRKFEKAVAEGRVIVKDKHGYKEKHTWETEDQLLEGREEDFHEDNNQYTGHMLEKGAGKLVSMVSSAAHGAADVLHKTEHAMEHALHSTEKKAGNALKSTTGMIAHSKSVKMASGAMGAAEKKALAAKEDVLKRSSTARDLNEGVSCLYKCCTAHVDHAHVDPDERPLGYFEQGWNWIDMINLLLFLAVIGCRLQMMYDISKVDFSTDKLTSHFYAEIVDQIAFGKLIDQINSINAILSFLKIFKYTSEHPQLGQFTKTLVAVVGDIAGFSVVFMIVLVGYAMSFQLAFGHDVEEFAALDDSMLALFTITLGDFDLDTLAASNYVLGPFLFFTFIIIVLFIVMSMMLVFVDEAYGRVSEEAAEALENGAEPDPLSSDLAYIVGIPGRIIGCILGAVDKVVRSVESAATGTPLYPEPEEVYVEPKRVEAAQDVDRLMLNKDKFIMFAATYRKSLECMYDMQDTQEQLEALLKEIDEKVMGGEFFLDEIAKAKEAADAMAAALAEGASGNGGAGSSGQDGKTT